MKYHQGVFLYSKMFTGHHQIENCCRGYMLYPRCAGKWSHTIQDASKMVLVDCSLGTRHYGHSTRVLSDKTSNQGAMYLCFIPDTYKNR